MYCDQCGKKILEAAKFCINCGKPVQIVEVSDKLEAKQSPYDAVEELKKQLRKISNRRKPATKKTAITSVIDKVKKEAREAGFVSDDSFEEQKIEDKEQLIADFPIPNSPEALLAFAKYIYSKIPSKKNKADDLTGSWKEKLSQVYLFAKKEFRETDEFVEIQRLYKSYKRRERHFASRGFVWCFVYFNIITLFAAFVYHLPFFVFLSILAACCEAYFLLYFYDLLDDSIASLKRKSSKLKISIKILKVVAWHLLAPTFAALITSIIYSSVLLICVFAVIFIVSAIFLIILYDVA